MRVFLLFLFIFPTFIIKLNEKSRTIASLGDKESEHKIIFILLDGLNNSVFRTLLDSGELPFFSKMLINQPNSKFKGIYTPATSVWPSTTGPGYAPFISGLYPKKSNLTGIRMFNRSTKKYRVFAGSDVFKINNVFTKEFPTIYEVLEKDESFSQTGFIFRRGWKENGDYLKANASKTSITGLCEKIKFRNAKKKIIETDFKNMYSFMNKTLGKKRLQGAAEKSFFKVRKEIGKKASTITTIDHLVSSFYEKFIFRGKKALDELPLFSFISLHAPDSIAHKYGVGEEYKESVREMDFIMGWLLEYLKQIGESNVSLVISSDHGVDPIESEIEHHHVLIEDMASTLSLNLRDSEKRMTFGFNRNMKKEMSKYQGFSTISGNSNMQIYLKNDQDWQHKLENLEESKHISVEQLEQIAKIPSIENIYIKKNKNEYLIFNAYGQSRIQAKKNLYRYQVIQGEDPLAYKNSSEDLRDIILSEQYLSTNEWAALTKHSNYPDGIQQIVQLLDAKNSGDIIVDAKVGYEPWDEMQEGVHGALRKDHLLVPLIIYSKELDLVKSSKFLREMKRFPRTVDLYPTMLKGLGRKIPHTIKFQVDQDEKEVDVRTDIDGERLDIWKSY